MPPDENLSDPKRQFSKAFFGDAEPDMTKNRDFFEQSKLAEALRNAKPEFMKDGMGLMGRQPARKVNEVQRTDFPPGKVSREPYQPFFPAEPAVEGGATTGTPVDIYGSVNGAPAIFHLLQTAPPTVPPPA